MKHIALIGVGLIGGSIGLSLKKQHACHITGCDLNPDTLRLAQTLGVIDQGTSSLEDAVAEADLIILSVPVGYLYEVLERIYNADIKEGVIITDTGSTKGRIVDYAQTFQDRPCHFIGGHPMAGSHKSGVEAAHERLLENAYYVLTPTETTPRECVRELQDLLSVTKAKVIVMDPHEHDEVVGAISHFPHVVASLLVNQVARFSEKNGWYGRLAAGGFRDLTRIASSNAVMWRDILLNNPNVIKNLAMDWKKALDEIIQYVSEERKEEIESFFEHARVFRDQIPEKAKGVLHSLYDLFIDVPDHPGVIGKITTLLGEEEISLTNIEILEIREDIMGALRVTFRNEEDQERAALLLENQGYHVYIRD